MPSYTITIWPILGDRGRRTGYYYDSSAPPKTPPSEASGDLLVEPNDEVIWNNQDTVPHWPGVTAPPNVVNPPSYAFMPNQIAANSSSTAWTVDPSVTSLLYFDSLDRNPDRPTGTITVELSKGGV